MPAAPEYLVFSQRSELTADLAALSAQAARFFAARFEAGSSADRIVVVQGEKRAERELRARERNEEDLALADAAEVRVGGGGLALLARRCPTVWRIERQSDSDPVALRLAAVLASVLLGPIVDPSIPEIFGVKTARVRL